MCILGHPYPHLCFSFIPKLYSHTFIRLYTESLHTFFFIYMCTLQVFLESIAAKSGEAFRMARKALLNLSCGKKPNPEPPKQTCPAFPKLLMQTSNQGQAAGGFSSRRKQQMDLLGFSSTPPTQSAAGLFEILTCRVQCDVPAGSRDHQAAILESLPKLSALMATVQCLRASL